MPMWECENEAVEIGSIKYMETNSSPPPPRPVKRMLTSSYSRNRGSIDDIHATQEQEVIYSGLCFKKIHYSKPTSIQ